LIAPEIVDWPLSTERSIKHRRFAIASMSSLDNAVGSLTSSRLRRPRRPFFVVVIDCLLAVHFNQLGLTVSDLHADASARRRNRQLLIAKLAHEVERLLRRSLVRESQCICRDVLLYCFADLWRRREEAVRRHQAIESLMRPLKVVCLHEERESFFAVCEVVEHRLRQELVPQRLPEPLDLPKRHRVLRAALDVRDPVLAQRLFKLRLSSPRRVLATIVGEDL